MEDSFLPVCQHMVVLALEPETSEFSSLHLLIRWGRLGVLWHSGNHSLQPVLTSALLPQNRFSDYEKRKVRTFSCPFSSP